MSGARARAGYSPVRCLMMPRGGGTEVDEATVRARVRLAWASWELEALTAEEEEALAMRVE